MAKILNFRYFNNHYCSARGSSLSSDDHYCILSEKDADGLELSQEACLLRGHGWCGHHLHRYDWYSYYEQNDCH